MGFSNPRRPSPRAKIGSHFEPWKGHGYFHYQISGRRFSVVGRPHRNDAEYELFALQKTLRGKNRQLGKNPQGHAGCTSFGSKIIGIEISLLIGSPSDSDDSKIHLISPGGIHWW